MHAAELLSTHPWRCTLVAVQELMSAPRCLLRFLQIAPEHLSPLPPLFFRELQSFFEEFVFVIVHFRAIRRLDRVFILLQIFFVRVEGIVERQAQLSLWCLFPFVAIFFYVRCLADFESSLQLRYLFSRIPGPVVLRCCLRVLVTPSRPYLPGLNRSIIPSKSVHFVPHF